MQVYAFLNIRTLTLFSLPIIPDQPRKTRPTSFHHSVINAFARQKMYNCPTGPVKLSD